MTTAVNAWFIPVPEIADRLALAAWTTLGIPSAAAAVAATAPLAVRALRDHLQRRFPR